MLGKCDFMILLHSQFSSKSFENDALASIDKQNSEHIPDPGYSGVEEGVRGGEAPLAVT